MKKLIMVITLVAMIALFSSCKQQNQNSDIDSTAVNAEATTDSVTAE